MDALKAFGRVDFDWTVNQTGVWRDVPHDVPEIHAEALEEVLERMQRLEGSAWADTSALPSNPFGAVLVGEAGVGKTHLLGRLRRTVIERGGTFLLADLTDVRDFWDTALQGAVSSLTRRLPSGVSQLERVLDSILVKFGSGALAGTTAEQLAELRPPALINRHDELVEAILKVDRCPEHVRYAPVLRALLLLASSEPTVMQLGEAWLSGLDVREESQMVHDLPPEMPALDRLHGVVWWAHHHGPTVLAVDQIDAITSEARAAAQGGTTGPEAIFTRATYGLMGLWERLPRTLVVLSCLQDNWRYILQASTTSVTDRFEDPILLTNPRGSPLQDLLERRLALSYAPDGFAPPYPSFPFQTSCFDGLELTPRHVLRRADAHRRRCLRARQLEELSAFEVEAAAGLPQPDDRLATIDADYAELTRAVPVDDVLAGSDSELDRLLETAARALALEAALPDRLDIELDLDFGRGGKVEPLHARLRVIDREDGDRERHLSLRFVQQPNPVAVQTRLRKALTESGLGEDLEFRRLLIFRRAEMPGGPKTKALFEEVEARGGRFVDPTDQEVRALAALKRLFEGRPDGFEEWLAARRPVSGLPSFREQVPFLFAPTEATPAPTPDAPSTPVPAPDLISDLSEAPPPGAPPPPAEATALEEAGPAPQVEAPKASPTTPPEAPIELGHEKAGLGRGAPVCLRPSDLPRHVAVLAAAGSGKTVLVRRLVEEAARRGIPSVVIDGANDLARFGEAWPMTPPSFDDTDAAAAEDFFARSETVVWTPGSKQGNPISADPLPDFGALSDAPDELAHAQTLARELLAADLKLGNSAPAKAMKAILQRAIEAYARQGGRDLHDLLQILREPGAVVDGFPTGPKQAAKLAESLQAEMTLNPLLGGGAPLDFGQLFGLDAERTRLSVVNLSGLSTLEMQQAFVARLATLLFTYVKSHPAPPGRVGGLVVLDEAKDFVPSGRAVASTQPILRLAAQLRKYGYALVVATQEPKSIDNKVVSNCSTQIFGRALAPATQEAVKQMMAQLGGASANVASLQKGQFFFSTPGHETPRKMLARWCLSHHGGPLTPDEIRARAAEDRARLGLA